MFALLFAGVYIISALAEPEFYDGYSLTQGGETIVEEATRNPNYLSGTKRQIYEFLYDFVPGAQLPQISGIDSDNALLLALYDVIILLVSTCVGIFVFRRKDLK